MHKIISFTGQMGVGKSEAINLLKEKLSVYNPSTDVRLVKFAQPLYDMQEFIYGRVASVHQRDENFIKDRKLLQWLGTEWGRGINENLWVNIWKAMVGMIADDYKAPHKNCIIVCDDCRFDNEAEAIKSLGGRIIRITSNKNIDRITTANGLKNHSSENGISDRYIDYNLENNSSLESYRNALSYAFHELDLA